MFCKSASALYSSSLLQIWLTLWYTAEFDCIRQPGWWHQRSKVRESVSGQTCLISQLMMAKLALVAGRIWLLRIGWSGWSFSHFFFICFLPPPSFPPMLQLCLLGTIFRGVSLISYFQHQLQLDLPGFGVFVNPPSPTCKSNIMKRTKKTPAQTAKHSPWNWKVLLCWDWGLWNMKNLTQHSVRGFLCTLSTVCDNNIEKSCIRKNLLSYPKRVQILCPTEEVNLHHSVHDSVVFKY